MFVQILKNINRREVFRKSQGCYKILNSYVLPFSCSRQFSQNVENIIVESPLPLAKYPDLTIDQYVWNNSSIWSSKTAVVDGVTDRSVTYGQLRDRCRSLAVRLQSVLQLKHGDTIAVCLPNSIEFPTVCLAGNEAGMIVTTVNPIYKAEEIARQLNDSDAKIIFSMTRMSKVLQEAVVIANRPIKIVYAKATETESLPIGGIDLNELISTQGIDLSSLITREKRDTGEIAVLPYSSGTTGLTKGVQLTHKNIVSNIIQANSETGGNCITQPAFGDYQDIVSCVLPFFHIYGLTCTLFAKLAHGCKLITLPSFTPETYLNALIKNKPTVLYLVPPIVIFLINFDKVVPQHMESVKYVMSGAAPLGQSDVERIKMKAPNTKFYQGYGLTETSPLVTVSPMETTNYASVGHLASDTTAKIVRVDDLELRGVGPNVSGELLVRGPQVMRGYHNNEKATKDTLTSDGWLRTGDIGHYDENQEFYITDRLKVLVKVKGFQVPPAELEEILRDHPDIADAAVIGIPDEKSGELPRAYVVSKNPKLSEKDVKDYVAQKVAKYKWLEGGVEFLTAIPKNATGKILRRELKDRYLST